METFVNDTIQLTIDTNIDISGYATLQIRYRKPDGTTGCWAATICPTDNNCMFYICNIDDLDIPGEWLLQGIALDAGVRLTGRWAAFQVHNPLMEHCTTVPPTTMVPTT